MFQVRALYNERGVQIDRATLSMPVQVTGWKTLPAAGDEVFEIESEVSDGRECCEFDSGHR